jgi:hypothetical protein
MPRVSQRALNIIQLRPNLPAKPVQPPACLTKEQRKEWFKIIESLPSGWFAEFNSGLLVQIVRHVSLATYLAKVIARTTNTAQLIQLAKIARSGRPVHTAIDVCCSHDPALNA